MSETKRELYMVGHAHLDAAWLWPWTESHQEVRATLRSAVNLLNEDPDYVFSVEQMVFLEWLKETDPPLFQDVQRLVMEKRIIPVGGWWVEPDANLPSLESFIRQGLYGQRFLQEHFGLQAVSAFNIDSFGHSAALPQILRKQGLTGYCFLRPGPHEGPLEHSLFNWVGIDGSRILSFRIPHEYCSPGEDLLSHVESAVAALVPTASGKAMLFYGVGNHGGGPTRKNLESIRQLQNSGEYGQVRFSSPDEFFGDICKSDTQIPSWDSDLQHHAVGTYSTLSNFKKLHVETEALLTRAERYSTIATLELGWDYPHDELEASWKLLLFNQFHDILPGTSIRSAQDDALYQLGGAKAQAQIIENRALQRILANVNVPFDAKTQPIVVFNAQPYTRSGLVEVEVALPGKEWVIKDELGAELPLQQLQPEATTNEAVDSTGLFRQRIGFPATVPALGYSSYFLEVMEGQIAKKLPAPCSSATLTEAGGLLSSGTLDVWIDGTTGWIARLESESWSTGLEIPKSRPHTVISPDESDTWGHAVRSYVKPGNQFLVNSIEVVEAGPLRSAIRVESVFGASVLRETFSLEAGSDVLQVRVEINWQEELSLLKLRLPLGLSADTARYQLQYGYADRPADDREQPGQRWVSITDSSSGIPMTAYAITDCKYAYDCYGGEIGITALRSPAYAWHFPKQLEADTRYSIQDIGTHSFTYAIYVTETDDCGVRANQVADDLLFPLDGRLESYHPGSLPSSKSFLEISGSSRPNPVSLSALKIAEGSESDAIIRVANNCSRSTSATIRTEMGNPSEMLVDLDPFEVATWRFSGTAKTPVAADMLEQPTTTNIGDAN